MTDTSTLLTDQTRRLLDLQYPALAGITADDLRAEVAPLHDVLAGQDLPPPTPSSAPFALVVTRALVRPEDTVPLLRLEGGSRPGVVDRNHYEGDLATYEPLPELAVPRARAYLLLGIERGEEFCGVAPEDALPVIRGRSRTPLTIDEGIAVVTHWPRLLERNRCFMLSGSRRGDRRVPALWISAGAPKLGWCWDGNPHTWLGVASASARVGPDEG